MNLKKWIYLFVTTLGVGAAGALVIGLIVQPNLWGTGFGNIVVGLIGHLGAGLLFSLISQMGFFAYLTIHNFGLGFFKSLWQGVQVILIVFAFFDLTYLRYTAFGSGENLLGYLVLPVVLLIYAFGVSYIKVKQTNRKAAVPAVFFIFVVSVIEWIPALRENNMKSMIYMMVPLLLCNTWQIMLLHRLVGSSKDTKQ